MSIEKINKSVRFDFVEKLKNTMPEVFEDDKVNFDKLRSLLENQIVESKDERFYFNWAGKDNIYKLIQAPAYETLRPDKRRSINFDDTENIVIVGDNLGTLKLLLKPYFGRVKMIYIDPPYNTGNDFIYRDNFAQPLNDYLRKTGQADNEGNRLTTNAETSGRYHSDWLNFVYPRLFLARSLLREDGIIFVSIDDNEFHHLRMIMDEIFGEENYLNTICWVNNLKGRQISGVGAARTHEYILTYAKNVDCMSVFQISVDKAKALMPNSYVGIDYESENDGQGEFVLKNELYNTNSRFNEETRPTLVFNIHYNFDTQEVKFSEVDEDTEYEGFVKIPPKKNNDGVHRFHAWRWSKEKIMKQLSDLKFIKKEDGVRVFTKVRGFDNTLLKDIVSDIPTIKGTNELKTIFDGKKVYDYPKPVELLTILLSQTKDEDIILDFFAGSGTTGHAVWEANKEDGGRRKFILIQIDEKVQNEEINKEFPTIADICIERLRRVSEKYRNNTDQTLFTDDNKDQDFGFKVFRLDKSNFNLKDEFLFDPSEDRDELRRKYLEWLGLFVNEPLIPGWRKIDVLYEVILKEGFDLNSKIEDVQIEGNKFYHIVDQNQNLALYICLDSEVPIETVEEIRTKKYKDATFVFIDNALTDSDKINLATFVRLKVI